MLGWRISALGASRCIDADPYAVLRYGDAETLTVGESRELLAALKNLSEEDSVLQIGRLGPPSCIGSDAFGTRG